MNSLKLPRILAAVGVLQVLGAWIGFASNGSWVFACVGAAAATVPGILFGAVWRDMMKRDWFPTAVLAAVLAAAFFGFALPRLLRNERLMVQLKTLAPREVRRIDVQNRYGTGPVTPISDAEAVAAFDRAVSEAEAYSPNHPGYTRSWYVVLVGPSRLELELHLEPRAPGLVFGYFVNKEGSTTWYHGSFQCAALRPWVSRYLEAP